MSPSAEELDQSRIAREEQREADQRARDRKHSWQMGLFAAGRVFLGSMFAFSAVGMLADYSGTIASLQETLLDVHLVLPFALIFQLVGGLALAAGMKARPAAAGLAIYLVLELLVAPPDLATDLGRAVAFSHLGLLGALAMILAHGPGRLSVDHLFDRRRRSKAAHHRGATIAPTL